MISRDTKQLNSEDKVKDQIIDREHKGDFYGVVLSCEGEKSQTCQNRTFEETLEELEPEVSNSELINGSG